MADLIVIAYDTEATAEAARKKLLELQKEYLIELGDAVVAVRQPDGHVKLNQLVSTTAAGAASGGMWGALVGLLFLNPLLGAAIGAGATTIHWLTKHHSAVLPAGTELVMELSRPMVMSSAAAGE